MLERVGDFDLRWGESLRWDDRRSRLYFVDCATQRLHWLQGGEPPLQTLELAGMPTGVVLTEGSELVVCLDDGLTVVEPDSGRTEKLTAYPDGMHGRANDAAGDGAGNLVTGTLNIGPGPGALWWFSGGSGGVSEPRFTL
jgi:sugar lactone lactonase YvrE